MHENIGVTTMDACMLYYCSSIRECRCGEHAYTHADAHILSLSHTLYMYMYIYAPSYMHMNMSTKTRVSMFFPVDLDL
jgi:hypothetical protein